MMLYVMMMMTKGGGNDNLYAKIQLIILLYKVMVSVSYNFQLQQLQLTQCNRKFEIMLEMLVGLYFSQTGLLLLAVYFIILIRRSFVVGRLVWFGRLPRCLIILTCVHVLIIFLYQLLYVSFNLLFNEKSIQLTCFRVFFLLIFAAAVVIVVAAANLEWFCNYDLHYTKTYSDDSLVMINGRYNINIDAEIDLWTSLFQAVILLWTNKCNL